jgi:Arc/MetJ family transcription regulator
MLQRKTRTGQRTRPSTWRDQTDKKRPAALWVPPTLRSHSEVPGASFRYDDSPNPRTLLRLRARWLHARPRDRLLVCSGSASGRGLAGAVDLCGGMCNDLHMATNLAIDDHLLEEALRIGGHRTKKDTVTEALQEYIQRRKQAQVIELFGKIDVDPKYDYKKARRRQ